MKKGMMLLGLLCVALMIVGSGCGKAEAAKDLKKVEAKEAEVKQTIVQKAKEVPKRAEPKIEFELTGTIKTETGQPVKFCFVGEAPAREIDLQRLLGKVTHTRKIVLPAVKPDTPPAEPAKTEKKTD